MSIFDRFKKPPAEHWEELGNIEDAIQITGKGCRLPSSTPTPKEKTMANNTQARINAIKNEVSDLKVQLVKKGAEIGAQIHADEKARKEQAFNKECEEMGIRFW